MFGANALSLAWGTVGGTDFAAKIFADDGSPRAVRPWVRSVAWVALLGLFGAEVYVCGATAVSIEHKSPLLKCHYRVVPSSLAVARPTLGMLLEKRVTMTLSFTLEIENPSRHDLVIEDSRIEARQRDQLIATMALPAIAVARETTVRQAVFTPLKLELGRLDVLRVVSAEQWHLTLWVRVAPGVELPVFLD